jgi:hypothetical protein
VAVGAGQCSSKSIYHIVRYENMGFQLLIEKLLGVSRSPCVKRFCGPLRALKAFQPQILNFYLFVSNEQKTHQKKPELPGLGGGLR